MRDLNSIRNQNQPSQPETVGYSTVIGKAMSVTGTVTADDNVRVDGSISGGINVNGRLFCSDTGNILGDIFASAVQVSGTVTGNIVASSVTLLKNAKVTGDITVDATALIIETGAYLDGKIIMRPAANDKQE